MPTIICNGKTLRFPYTKTGMKKAKYVYSQHRRRGHKRCRFIK